METVTMTGSPISVNDIKNEYDLELYIKQEYNNAISVEFPDVISMLNTTTQDNVKTILSSFDFSKAIDSGFAKIYCYVKSCDLQPQDIRNIKQEKGSLYVFYGGCSMSGTSLQYDGEVQASTYKIGYVYPNIIAVPRPTEPCTQAIDTLANVEEQTQFAKVLVPEKIESITLQIIDSLTRERDAKAENLRTHISNIEIRIADLQSKLITQLEEKSSIEAELLGLLDKPINANAYKKSFDNLMKIKGVRDIEVRSYNNIDVYTNDIYVNSIGHRFYMGRFKISIDMNANSARIYNLVQECKRRSYWGALCNHPHVSDKGVPCLGEAATGFMDACRKHRVDIACIILINYLESVNPQDVAGQYLTNWDVVDDDGQLIDFPEELKNCHICGKRVTDNNYHNFHICHVCGENTCKDDSLQINTYSHEDDERNEKVWVCSVCEDKIVYCSGCGKMTTEIYKCSHCGSLVCADCVSMVDGTQCCNDCRENLNARACTNCGALTFNGSGICDECEKNVCSFCHNTSTHLTNVENGMHICPECFKTTDVCTFCGTRRKIDNLIINERSGIIRCKHGCERNGEE